MKHTCHCSCGSSLNRRQFLTGASACLGGVSFIFSDRLSFAETDKTGAMKVRLIFAAHGEVQDRADWPNIGFDFDPVMKKMKDALNANVEGIEFVSSMSTGAEQTQQILEEDAKRGDIAGYMVAQMNCWNQVVHVALTSTKPVLYYDFLYAGSGGYLAYTAQALQDPGVTNFAHISSESFDDVVEAAKAFQLIKAGKSTAEFVQAVTDYRIAHTKRIESFDCLEHNVSCLSPDELLKALRGCKILAIEKPWVDLEKQAMDDFGIEVVRLGFDQLNEEWEKADRDEAAKIVAHWKETAEAIVDVSEEVLMDSARMYIAERELMKKQNAQGITVDCLGGFYGGHIHAYPCLGFSELCNQGLIGGCECDIRSALTMLILSKMTGGQTGFISDPVLDISTKTIIYAHCVASYRAFGPNGSTNPYTIMTHSEDRQGAAVRSTLPVGYMTTTVEICPITKQILFHQAKAVGNSTNDRACRTKLVAEVVGDFEKLYTQWGNWGWHRVTVYGDLKKEIFALADAIGYKIVEEA